MKKCSKRISLKFINKAEKGYSLLNKQKDGHMIKSATQNVITGNDHISN